MKSHSARAQSLPRSGIREVMEFAAGRDGIIKLHVGEPSFRTPEHIIEAAFAAARGGHTRYTANAGTPELRQAVADRYAPRYGHPVSASEVLIGAGAVNAIAAMLFALVEEGEEVLVPDPGWPNYHGQVMLAHGVAVPYPLKPENDWLPDVADLERLVTPRTKVVILNNPSNPCGVVWPRETVRAVMEWADRHDLWVISDEIYEDLVYDGEMVPAASFGKERTISIGGCSKSYAMTGWRIGWAIADAPLVALAGKLQEALVSCPSEVSQEAALAALTGPQECVEHMRQAYEARRDLVRSLLEPAGLPASVTDAVLQHHERLSGSGYPEGLSGEEILFGEVLVWGAKDVPSEMPVHASQLYAMNVYALLTLLAKDGAVQADPADEIIDGCAVVLDGDIRNETAQAALQGGA